ncbi:hypothetical protein F511_12502, partial [Dorcoceras hygrometricum]
LAAEGGVAVAMDNFQCVDLGGMLMPDFVDCAAVTVAENLELLEFRGGDGGVGGGGCTGSGGGGR